MGVDAKIVSTVSPEGKLAAAYVRFRREPTAHTMLALFVAATDFYSYKALKAARAKAEHTENGEGESEP